ncbi:MAG: phosphate acetyltransferase [Bacteroidales bacterium]|nr:phosphate acetyltransferase [Bacteroidales bacterium]
MDFLTSIKNRAKQFNKTIALPEGEEERTLVAADEILRENLAKIILYGNKDLILKKSAELGLANIEKARIIDPVSYEKKEELAEIMVEMRKSKGMTKEKALEDLLSPYYLATLMIKNKEVDGMVGGAVASTATTIRPAFQYIKTLSGISVVSGAFFMIIPDTSFGENGILVFADCAVHPNPTERELAEIAVASAKTAKSIGGFEPKVAMLSFSTMGSAENEMVDKVRNATKIAKEMQPDLQIDGEMQADAAIIAAIGEKKAPGSTVAGHANVLVFPDLNSGNIAYKLVQRLAKAEAIGPVLQGMAAPINDLSRGCSASDIVNLVAITANQAAGVF